MRKTFIVVALLLAATSTPAAAQPLGQVATEAAAERAAKACVATAAAPCKPTLVITNKDLTTAQRVTQPQFVGVAPISSAPEAMREDAAERYRDGVGILQEKMNAWVSQVHIVTAVCDSASYNGLTRGALQAHLFYCRKQLDEATALRKVAADVAFTMEVDAQHRGIWPGVMRELFATIGWE
jgi:hypothetical protein